MPAEELEKARALAKGRFVLQTESPNGLILFGLRREVLEGRAAEPEEVLAGLDAVTADDVLRVAQDVIGERRHAPRRDRPVRRRVEVRSAALEKLPRRPGDGADEDERDGEERELVPVVVAEHDHADRRPRS